MSDATSSTAPSAASSGAVSSLKSVWNKLSYPVESTVEEGMGMGRSLLRVLRWVWVPAVMIAAIYNIEKGELESGELSAGEA